MKKSDPEIYKEEVDSEDDDLYAAPTKVGPISNASIAGMVSEAEPKPVLPPPRPPAKQSGTRPATTDVSPASGLQKSAERVDGAGDDLPSIAFEEDQLDPTLLNESGWTLPSDLAPVATAPPAGVVDSIIEEMSDFEAAELDDDWDDVEAKTDAASEPDAVLGSNSNEPGKPSSPSTNNRSLPVSRPAAFPEWIGVTWRVEMDREKRTDRKMIVRIAVGAGALVATATLLVWWLFSIV